MIASNCSTPYLYVLLQFYCLYGGAVVRLNTILDDAFVEIASVIQCEEMPVAYLSPAPFASIIVVLVPFLNFERPVFHLDDAERSAFVMLDMQ